MPIELRPYQSDIIEEARSLMRSGRRSFIIVSPTGSGKTVLTAQMLYGATLKSVRSLFIVHRRELVQQSSETFTSMGLSHGIIAAGVVPHYNAMCQIANVGSISRRLDSMHEPQLIVIDECHHTAAETWRRIIERYPKAFLIGLTATPERLDGQGLGEFFSSLITGPSVRTLQSKGFLSKYKLYAPPLISTKDLKKRAGEFILSGEVEASLTSKKIVGNAVDMYRRYAAGKRFICFCATIEHSRSMARAYIDHGISCVHVDGTTPTKERDEAIDLFRSGKVMGLCNVNLFGEGFDVPMIECVQQLRPTDSLVLHRQQVGRALRPHHGKDYAIILDHVENTMRHGTACAEIDWDLNGKSKKKANHVRICPVCFFSNESGSDLCANCGSILSSPESAKKKRADLSEADEELVEIDPLEVELRRRDRLKTQGMAHDLASLIELGKSRGYKHPYAWAKHIMAARKRKAS